MESDTMNLKLAAAFGAACAAEEQDLRGYYPMAARVLADRAKSLKSSLDQKHAEYEDMKSLLLGNARNLNLEVLRLRESEKALVATLRDEIDEGLRLRELGGARPDEGITAMTERVVAENVQLRAELARRDASTQSEMHAHTDWVDDDVPVRHPRA